MIMTKTFNISFVTVMQVAMRNEQINLDIMKLLGVIARDKICYLPNEL